MTKKREVVLKGVLTRQGFEDFKRQAAKMPIGAKKESLTGVRKD